MNNLIKKNLEAKVINSEKMTDDMHRIVFEYLGDEEWSFAEGQFLMINNIFKNQRVVRAYSISSLSSDLPQFELIIKRVESGLMSNYLCDLTVGEKINFDGPYGDFLWNKGVNKNKVLVAIGCGLAPLKSILLKQIEDKNFHIELYLGSRFADQIPGKDFFDDLEKNNSNFKFYPCISRGDDSCQYRGRVNQVMLEQDIDFTSTDFYLCGTAQMIADIKNMVIENGGSLDNVFNENIYPYVSKK